MTGPAEDAEAILAAIDERDHARRWARPTEATCEAILARLRRREPGERDPIAELAARRMNQWLATLQDDRRHLGQIRGEK